MTMHRTLLLRLDGPMQAWGTNSRFSIRETRREPSKSGVIGLVAAALGRPRSDSVHDLAALRFGVRVDREGQILRDFHTAGKDGFYRASGSIERNNVIVSERFYLADACFTVGFEGTTLEQHALLQKMHDALLNPIWPLYLGRRAFPPAAPIISPGLGIVNAPLCEALQAAPLPPPSRPQRGQRVRDRHDALPLRFVFDADTMSIHDARRTLAGADVPLSFISHARRYRTRETITLRLPLIDSANHDAIPQ